MFTFGSVSDDSSSGPADFVEPLLRWTEERDSARTRPEPDVSPFMAESVILQQLSFGFSSLCAKLPQKQKPVPFAV